MTARTRRRWQPEEKLDDATIISVLTHCGAMVDKRTIVAGIKSLIDELSAERLSAELEKPCGRT